MPPAASLTRAIAQTAETLIIALAGGAAFTLLGFPAGLISGSVLAVATAALLGRPVYVPVVLAWVGYVLIGILLGAVVTPQTVKGFAAWPVSIALVMVGAICMMLTTASYLRIVHCWEQAPARWRKSSHFRPRSAPTCRRSPSCRPCGCCCSPPESPPALRPSDWWPRRFRSRADRPAARRFPSWRCSLPCR